MHEWDFDGDEGFSLVIALIITIGGGISWYIRVARIVRWRAGAERWLVALTPPLAITPLLLVLRFLADPLYVAGHLDYQLLFLLGGFAWIWVTSSLLPLLGLSVRDDVLERHNPAAAVAACGTICGTMLIYAGANIGGGPTIWTTLLPAFVATVAYLALLLLIEWIAPPSEAIAVDRDLATAIRHAAGALAIAIVLARSVAGDWRGWDSTWQEMGQQGWPAAIVAAIILLFHRRWRPAPVRPRPAMMTTAVVPGALLLAAAAYVASLGPPEIGKHLITYEQYTGRK